MAIIIPALVGVLQPSEITKLHQIAFQILMSFAAAAAGEFRNQVAQLADVEKSTLEASVRLSVAQQQAEEAKKIQTAVASAAPLKFDFSKYNATN
jgi:hypothetical protein